MLVNSIKTKNNFHNYIVIKQSDNTSPIEILLCGANGSILSDLNQSCTLTILDEVDQLIRQKTTEQIVNGTVTFRVANDLKTNPHTLEITTADGQKFPSNHDFKIFVSYTHDESELKVINNLSRDEALAEIDISVKKFISENTPEFIDKVATGEWLNANEFKVEEPVATKTLLPSNAQLKEMRLVIDENKQYLFNGIDWIEFGAINADGLSLIRIEVDNLSNSIEIEPDDLRESPDETDGDLLQKAVNVLEQSNKNNKSIKLGRIYDIDKTIMLSVRVDLNVTSHININGRNGGLRLSHDGYMFDGVKSSGGIKCQQVKFIGSSFTKPIFNCNNLIQIVLNECDFIRTYSIFYADPKTGYLQSCRMTNCNSKGMMTYQIIAAKVYDVHILSNLVEWGRGGLIDISQGTAEDVCSIGLFIENNVIEGISEQIPIITGAHGKAVISNNYFEGNTYTDIDMSRGSLPHRGITIRDNSFGDYVISSNKDSCVKVGKGYSDISYDFRGNMGVKTIFDFSGSYGKFDLAGGMLTYSRQPSYKNATLAVIHDLGGKSAKNAMTVSNNSFMFYPNKTFRTLLEEIYTIKAVWNRTESKLYGIFLAGQIHFVSGYDTTTSQNAIEVRLIPTLIQDTRYFSPQTSLSAAGISVKFSSTGTSKRLLSTLDVTMDDTIIIECVASGVSGGRSAYYIKMTDLITN
ncbi:hypothetical protein ETI11_01485 [Macrococcoides canis]|uniref:hypothetical protein n=1 Tax=Macrococcoides canis TaxID=1855823 RepID=UPI00105EC51B|nr:hypothetical protein [Macrococcus canis]TDM38093.1 hypothetical protein ETI11_01485 [Macrococcus canis]